MICRSNVNAREARFDRYDSLVGAVEDMLAHKWVVYEFDIRKGSRVTSIDGDTGYVLREDNL